MNTATTSWAVLRGAWTAEWGKLSSLSAQDWGGCTSNTVSSCGPLSPKLMWGNQRGPVEGELDGQKPTAYVLQGQVEGVRMLESGKEEVKGQSNCSLQLLKRMMELNTPL